MSYKRMLEREAKQSQEWTALLDEYVKANPEKALEVERVKMKYLAEIIDACTVIVDAINWQEETKKGGTATKPTTEEPKAKAKKLKPKDEPQNKLAKEEPKATEPVEEPKQEEPPADGVDFNSLF